MSVILKIGRRVPKNWFKRMAGKGVGLITFQENIWQMIKQSMALAKRKCNASGKGSWIQKFDRESESLHYDIEWLIIHIQGNEAFEKEEYEEALNMYKAFGKKFKKELPKDKNMSSFFKSKILNSAKVKEAYTKGYGSMSDNNIANKLLEMGILTHIEWEKDFELRNEIIKPDF